MRKILVGLTVGSMNKLICEERQYLVVITNLLQHRLLFSETILAIYERFFSEKDLLDEFQQWIASYGTIGDFITFENSVSKTFELEMLSLLNKSSHSILIECVDSKWASVGGDFSVLDLDEINKIGSNNELSRQCIPANFILPKNFSKQDFCNWLKEVFEDETDIYVIDKFIMSNGASDILDQVYIPNFPSNAKINVYFGDREMNQAEVSKMKNTYGERVHLYSAISNDFHDRFIVGNSIVVAIGVGLDVFTPGDTNSRQQTTILLNSIDNKPSFPRRSNSSRYARC